MQSSKLLIPLRYIIVLAITTAALWRIEDVQALENNSFLDSYFDTPEQVGQGLFKALFLKIYEAELISEDGNYESEKPFALQITYLRNLKGVRIVDASMDLIADQGVNDPDKLDQWQEVLNSLIPDVAKGDRLTGVKTPSQTSFYLNDSKMGDIEDPELSEYFFNIWLAESTTAPKLRLALLGQTNN